MEICLELRFFCRHLTRQSCLSKNAKLSLKFPVTSGRQSYRVQLWIDVSHWPWDGNVRALLGTIVVFQQQAGDDGHEDVAMIDTLKMLLHFLPSSNSNPAPGLSAMFRMSLLIDRLAALVRND